jgi:hypothetical protein
MTRPRQNRPTHDTGQPVKADLDEQKENAPALDPLPGWDYDDDTLTDEDIAEAVRKAAAAAPKQIEEKSSADQELVHSDAVKTPAKKAMRKSGKPVYEEWTVSISNGKYEKLKRVRAEVRITDEHAETLNSGILQGGNAYASMYFLPGED